jgi:protein-tyrosine phosphatase
MEKKKVLFVCLGNICRSPAAEGVFNYLVKEHGLQYAFEIDSAGTAGYHSGEPADERMQKHALKRGYNLTSISRKFNPAADFDKFDLVVAMDDENVSKLKRMARSPEDLIKISKMTDYRKVWNYNEIPDPYYGGDDGFELVLDLLEDACEGLLEKIT